MGMRMRQFVEDEHRVVLARRLGKNSGLYAQKVGRLSIMGESVEEEWAVQFH